MAKLLTRLKYNWKFAGFNERKTIKNKYKNLAGTQDKVIQIKEEIER